jgi:hypothetical protein
MAFDWGNAFRGGASGAVAGNSLMPGWGGLIGGGLGALGGLFGGGNDAYKDADKYLDQIPDQLKQYLMPYINAGQNSLGKVGGEYDKLLADPNSIISRIGSGYKESPGYQWRLNQGTNAINNANAAGGMAGTGQHQQQAGELAGNLANQDYQQYLNQALGLYGTGLQGHQGLTNLGAEAGGSLGNSLAQALMMRGGLGYQRGLNQNQQNSDLFGSILSFLKPGNK